MLVTLNDVLVKARMEQYAVPAFDCMEDLLIRPILDACEELNSPVILMALEHDLKGRGFDYIASIVKGVAPKYNIPIVLHLDHANEFELIERAIEYGVTSVMYDGSNLSFEENIENTRRVVRLAHSKGISVEAELGRVAGKELEGQDSGEMKLTNPNDVSRFIEDTQVDALAVSIGTAHGIYESTPNLNIEILKEINRISKVPLVLHGGSGTPANQIQNAIKNGISKINLYADIRIAMMKGLKKAIELENREDPVPDKLFKPVKDAIKNVVKDKIKMSMSEGKGKGLK